MHHSTDRIAHTTAFVTPVVEHWLEREIAQWVHPMKDRSDDPSHNERTLLTRSYISLLWKDGSFINKKPKSYSINQYMLLLGFGFVGGGAGGGGGVSCVCGFFLATIRLPISFIINFFQYILVIKWSSPIFNRYMYIVLYMIRNKTLLYL